MLIFSYLRADDCMKSAAYLSDTMTDPKTAHSQDPNETSIQKAFRFEGTRWEFLERPENLFMFRRYGAAMSGAAKLQPPWAVLTSKSPPSSKDVLTYYEAMNGTLCRRVLSL